MTELERIKTLTPTEHKVFLMLAQGLENKEIALRRGVGVQSVKQHVMNIKLKLACYRDLNRVEMCRLAIRNGLIEA